MEWTLKDKTIKIIFEDGEKHFSKKEGVCTRETELDITLDNKNVIMKSRIIRVEVIE